ncbi:CRISPR-associated endonuclease/helicase Cas3 [Murinocardiopsis flavida]|uniref:CRISPR-associated endonuclease/helicase Cas3 n=1 Tax=Murinocardiopsis flavida TaxID=645275 RepID=A0A2P8CWR0_9ACTN|nr:CRISPR-associated helicase Cas3' [Murinocardiopsis flavida]PSK89408.1 CRISPR-associated endonuclease/helicase Cas3 [Murinocardiopsis flavida]
MVDAQTIQEWARPWAKHTKKHGVHALACHLIDTMEVAYRLYPIILGPKVRKELDRIFAPLDGSARDWVALLCGLHDLGKYTPAFQSLVLEVALARFPEKDHPVLERNAPAKKGQRWDTKHGLGTAVHLQDMLEAAGASRDTALLIGHILGGHHGWFPNPGEVRAARGKDDLGDRSWAEARSELVQKIAGLRGLDFGTPAWSEVEVTALGLVGLAGLTTLADWVASDSSRFAYEPNPEDIHAYQERAREQADRTLRTTNWSAWIPPERTGYRDLFKKDPRPLQKAVEASLDQCDGPGVLVIEAPTGEGKTRAGLQAAADLARRLGLGGLYFATPTKALSRQALNEVRKLMEGTGSPLDVNLVYGGAAKDMRAERVEAQILPSAVGEEDAGDDGGQNSLEWFTRKRGLAFPIGAGTIDQLLKSVIRSGHNYLGMASISNKVVVIDEAHAYDMYTGRLVDQFLWFCGWMGVPVVLMSATLPANRREELVEYWRAGAESRAPDRERVRVLAPGSWQVAWTGGTGSPSALGLSDETKARGALKVEHVDESPDAIAEQVVARVGDEGTALIVLNTKTRAQDVRDRIAKLLVGKEDLPELVLFTGESQGVDRTRIEEQVHSLLGGKSPEERHAIVVGTQVLEHGLDIDADLLVSDLCPIDLLFQRAGRLHRHRRTHRPSGLGTPTLLVADVNPERRAARGPGDRGSMFFAPHIAKIYAPLILGRTRVVLSEVLAQERWDPLDEIAKQIHRVYVAEESMIEDGWEGAWDNADSSYDRRRKKLRFQASSVMTSLIGSHRDILRLSRRSGPAGRTRPTDGREKGRK